MLHDIIQLLSSLFQLGAAGLNAFGTRLPFFKKI